MKQRDTLKKYAAALLVVCILMAAVCAMAEGEAIAVSEAAREVCLAEGGELLGAVKAMSVASPYGTPSVVLRSVPADSYDAVAMLMVGQRLAVIGVCGDFYYVLLEDGSAGWLAADELK